MEKTKKKELIKLLTIAIPFFLCISYIIWFYIHDAKQLEEESIYTRGVITEKYLGPKVQHFVRYEFFVNKVKYTSSWGYSLKYDNVEIGDTCFVIYTQSNPENCKLVEIMYQGKSIIKLKKLSQKIAPRLLPILDSSKTNK